MLKKFTIQVKTNSKHESVALQSDGSLLVRVNAPPIEGKANERVIELLSEHLNVPKSKLTLTSGLKSKRKVITLSS